MTSRLSALGWQQVGQASRLQTSICQSCRFSFELHDDGGAYFGCRLNAGNGTPDDCAARGSALLCADAVEGV